MNSPVKSHRQKLALRADSGLAVGHFYPLGEARNVIGRRVDAVVAVDDSKVSRNHAAVDVKNGFYVVVDLGSTNGTFVNGRRVEQPVFLNPGDQIRVGSTVLVVDYHEKARSLSGKNWKEPTRVVFGSEVAALASKPVAAMGMIEAPIPKFGQGRWARLLSDKQKINARIYGRWVALAVSVMLTVAAIAMRI